MTYVINRSLPLSEASLIPLRGILTVLQSLKSSGVPNPHFWWPGDIMIQDRKVGGVLEEYHVRGGQIRWYALGIGLHLNDTLPGSELTSVMDITGLNLNRRQTVRLLKETWDQNLCLTPTELCRELTAYAGFLHKHVRIQTGHNETIEGIAQSIDTEGRLCLVSDSYTTRVSAGESIKLTITGERNHE
jgi:biotin-(acetyl-CoA carboxylase) ligase